MPRPLLILTAALALTACQRPTDVAVQFHESLAAGNGTKAFSLLSAKTQAELTKVAKAAHDATGGVMPADPALMIQNGDTTLYPMPGPKSPKVVTAAALSVDGARAKVSVKIGEAQHEMDLVREGGRWRVDLPLTGVK